jgi:hypothetical protein
MRDVLPIPRMCITIFAGVASEHWLTLTGKRVFLTIPRGCRGAAGSLLTTRTSRGRKDALICCARREQCASLWINENDRICSGSLLLVALTQGSVRCATMNVNQ